MFSICSCLLRTWMCWLRYPKRPNSTFSLIEFELRCESIKSSKQSLPWLLLSSLSYIFWGEKILFMFLKWCLEWFIPNWDSSLSSSELRASLLFFASVRLSANYPYFLAILFLSKLISRRTLHAFYNWVFRSGIVWLASRSRSSLSSFEKQEFTSSSFSKSNLGFSAASWTMMS